jgi:hypothetical protein
MGRIARVVGLCSALLACTSVKMVQREGCWVKQTERTLGGSTEELGFCAKARPQWAEDRLARLVQECMAQADYRWQNRAIAAWSRDQPIPAQEADTETTKACMSQATAALGVEAENQQLRARVAELGQDRDSLKSAAEKDREFLQQSSDKLVTALGEAAKRPSPTATATATGTGTAKSDTPAPAMEVVSVPTPVVLTPASARPAVRRAPAACPTRQTAGKLAAEKDAAKAPACDTQSSAPTAQATPPPHEG